MSEFQYKFVFTSAFYNGVPASGWDKAPLSMMIYSMFFLPPFCEGGAILNWNWRTIFFKWRNIKLRKQGMHLIIVFNPLNYTKCSLLYNFKVGKVLYNTSVQDPSNFKCSCVVHWCWTIIPGSLILLRKKSPYLSLISIQKFEKSATLALSTLT